MQSNGAVESGASLRGKHLSFQAVPTSETGGTALKEIGAWRVSEKGGRGREPGSGGRELQAVLDKPPAAQRGIWAPLTQPAQPAALRKTQATVRGDHSALPGSYLRRVGGAASPGLWGLGPGCGLSRGRTTWPTGPLRSTGEASLQEAVPGVQSHCTCRVGGVKTRPHSRV